MGNQFETHAGTRIAKRIKRQGLLGAFMDLHVQHVVIVTVVYTDALHQTFGAASRQTHHAQEAGE